MVSGNFLKRKPPPVMDLPAAEFNPPPAGIRRRFETGTNGTEGELAEVGCGNLLLPSRYFSTLTDVSGGNPTLKGFQKPVSSAHWTFQMQHAKLSPH